MRVTSVIFRNKLRSMLETHSTKTTAVGESNNAEVLGRSPQPPEVNGGSRAEPPTLFTAYLFKNTHF